VRNKGGAAGPVGYVDVWANRALAVPCGAHGQRYCSVGVLAAGGSTNLAFTGLSAGWGAARTLRAFVDSGGATPELSEANNQAVKRYAAACTLDQLAAAISTPGKLLNWMGANISYGWPGWPDMGTWTYRSPQAVFSSRQGDCTSQSAFEAYVLRRHGYDCHLLWVDRHGYSDHGVCYWPEADGFHYLENAFGDFRGLYGPFPTVQRIARNMYAHMVQADGHEAAYTVSSYDGMAFGVDWGAFNALLAPP
jgi:hypothetical protein